MAVYNAGLQSATTVTKTPRPTTGGGGGSGSVPTVGQLWPRAH
jgi:hypothetical protein